jgi:hypothetical protein
MAKHVDIALDEVLADPAGAFRMVEDERATLSVMKGATAVAVISPAPVAETLADIHRALHEEPLDTTFFLDVIETRRLLGL